MHDDRPALFRNDLHTAQCSVQSIFAIKIALLDMTDQPVRPAVCCLARCIANGALHRDEHAEQIMAVRTSRRQRR